MNHRHLLPDEIDLLVDGELGFGVAPLRSHLDECADCRARVEEERAVVDALEGLPLLAPSHDFGSRVMAQVPVFVPWHAAAREAVVRWIPQSTPARVAAAVLGGSVASVLTVAMVWLLARTELLVLATSLVGDRARELAVSIAGSLVTALFGDQVYAAIQQAGLVGVALVGGAFLLSVFGAAFGLRAIAAAAGRRRS